ncbi:ABC transporter ATP-binding protein [Actinomadura sp. NBRC 104412]|uniref:ABC transporter ATP-binding protein n=1 Tax=Actinomadura sp. NBRC 104412 TaxID=3032203 RepID=UPI0024A220E0|nr:ABC transporter ATP-binding protein [Actinomadura sp. NBRC 104412]GLZ06185.1 ABC transporter ATP-binding protein [Actinomadura sp. NBRC 104412]
MTGDALSLSGLVVSYGGITAVHGVSLDVPEATCVGVLGANGAGKTSLLRAAGGLEPVRGGHVLLNGTDVTGKDAAARARMGLGHVLEGRRVFPGLSVRDNLALGATAVRGRTSTYTVDGVLALLPELVPHLGKAAGALSGGQQQMLAIGRALVGGPRVLLMDEPTNGLAPALVNRVEEIIMRITQEGTAVLLVEQRLEVAKAVCSRVHILQRGRLVGSGTPADPGLDRNLQDAYLS